MQCWHIIKHAEHTVIDCIYTERKAQPWQETIRVHAGLQQDPIPAPAELITGMPLL